ncbi:hypothetical protein LBMAG42_54540 [Deltaproteobacteria bacterium]|nr:hypothetical protein LBMAG42_54540 [Deltaproteobacteria bacterium]
MPPSVGRKKSALKENSNAGLGTVVAGFFVVCVAGALIYGWYMVATHKRRLAADMEAFHEAHAHDLDQVTRDLEDAEMRRDAAEGFTAAQIDERARARALLRAIEHEAKEAAFREQVRKMRSGEE